MSSVPNKRCDKRKACPTANTETSDVDEYKKFLSLIAPLVEFSYHETQKMANESSYSGRERVHQAIFEKAPKDAKYCSRILPQSKRQKANGNIDHRKLKREYCWNMKTTKTARYCSECIQEQKSMNQHRMQFRYLKEDVRPPAKELFCLLPPSHFRVGVVAFPAMLRLLDIKESICSLDNLAKFKFNRIKTAPGSSYLLLDEGDINNDWTKHPLVKGRWSIISAIIEFGIKIASKLNIRGCLHPPELKQISETADETNDNLSSDMAVSTRTRSHKERSLNTSRYEKNIQFEMKGKQMGSYICNGYCLRPGFVVTDRYSEDQPAHLDFVHIPEKDIDKPWIINIPLCSEGMLMRINPDSSFPDQRLIGSSISTKISFGSFLCMRGDVVHAGSYGLCGNIRLHLIIQQHMTPPTPQNFQLQKGPKGMTIHPGNVSRVGPRQLTCNIQCTPIQMAYQSRMSDIFKGAIGTHTFKPLPRSVDQNGHPAEINASDKASRKLV